MKLSTYLGCVENFYVGILRVDISEILPELLFKLWLLTCLVFGLNSQSFFFNIQLTHPEKGIHVWGFVADTVFVLHLSLS